VDSTYADSHTTLVFAIGARSIPERPMGICQGSRGQWDIHEGRGLLLKQKQWTVITPSEDFKRRYPIICLELLSDNEKAQIVIRSKKYSHRNDNVPYVVEHYLRKHADPDLGWRQACRHYQKTLDNSML